MVVKKKYEYNKKNWEADLVNMGACAPFMNSKFKKMLEKIKKI